MFNRLTGLTVRSWHRTQDPERGFSSTILMPYIDTKYYCSFPIKRIQMKIGTVAPTSRCSESSGMLCWSNCDITAENILIGLETISSLISKLFHFNIAHNDSFLMMSFGTSANKRLALSTSQAGPHIFGFTCIAIMSV